MYPSGMGDNKDRQNLLWVPHQQNYEEAMVVVSNLQAKRGSSMPNKILNHPTKLWTPHWQKGLWASDITIPRTETRKYK